MDRLLTYNWLLETLQSFYIRSTPSVCRARMTSFARPPYSSGGQSINSTSQFNFPQQEGKSSIDPYAELNKTLAYCDCAGVVTESKIRTLARSLTCISRIDKYLVLETKENAIEFRAITDVQDAYIQIRFTSKFFSAFGFAPHIVRQRDPTAMKIHAVASSRACASIFRSMGPLDAVIVGVSQQQWRLVFVLIRRDGLIKRTFAVQLNESDAPMYATIPPGLPNQLVLKGRLLNAAMLRISASEEVQIECSAGNANGVNAGSVTIRNSVNQNQSVEESRLSSRPHSEFTMPAADAEYFNVTSSYLSAPFPLIMNARGVKAFAAFVANIPEPDNILQIRFDSQGSQPVHFSTSASSTDPSASYIPSTAGNIPPSGMYADLVIATSNPDQDGSTQQQQHQQQQHQQQQHQQQQQNQSHHQSHMQQHLQQQQQQQYQNQQHQHQQRPQQQQQDSQSQYNMQQQQQHQQQQQYQQHQQRDGYRTSPNGPVITTSLPSSSSSIPSSSSSSSSSSTSSYPAKTDVPLSHPSTTPAPITVHNDTTNVSTNMGTMTRGEGQMTLPQIRQREEDVHAQGQRVDGNIAEMREAHLTRPLERKTSGQVNGGQTHPALTGGITSLNAQLGQLELGEGEHEEEDPGDQSPYYINEEDDDYDADDYG